MKKRDGIAMLEVLIALVMLVVVLVPTVSAMCASHHHTVRAEDLAKFQAIARTLMDAAARCDYRRLLAEASRAEQESPQWRDWQEQATGKPPRGLLVRSWIVEIDDPNAVLFTVEVRWTPPGDVGRRTAYATQVSRVLVRPEASLSMNMEVSK